MKSLTARLMVGVLLSAVVIPALFVPDLYDIYDLTKATALRVIVILLVSFLVLHLALGRGFKIPRSPLFAPVLALVAVAVVTTVFSTNPIISTIGGIKRHEGWPTFLAYGLLMAGAITLLRRRHLDLLTSMIAGVTVVLSVYGILQRFGVDFMDFGSVTGYDLTRAFATSGNPVFLGTYTALVAPFLAMMAIGETGSRVRRILYAAGSGLAYAACVFTYSRGAWLGLLAATVIGLVAVVAVFGWRTGARRLLPLVLVAALAIIPLGAVAIFKPAGSQFTSSVTERAAAALDTGEGSAGTRIEMWRSSLGIVAERPLMGTGLETFNRVFPAHRSLKLIKLEGEFAMPDRPHNQLLYMATSMGLLGMTAFLWLFIAFLWLCARWVRRLNWKAPDALSRWAMTGIGLAVIAVFISEATSFTTVNTTPLAFMLMGFAGALALRSGDEMTLRIPGAPHPAVTYPLITLVFIWTVFSVQYVARFPAADLQFNLTRFSRAALQHQKAQGEAEAAVRLNPYFNIYRMELGGVYTDVRNRTGDVEWRRRAAAVYMDAVALDPYDEDAWANLGNSYLDLAQEGYPDYLERSKEAFRRAVAIDPYFSVAHTQLGSIYLAERRYREAVAEFEKSALTQEPPPDQMMLKADAMAGAGDLSGALREYESVLKKEPTRKDAKEAAERTRKALDKAQKE